VPLICIECNFEAKDGKALQKKGGKIILSRGLRAVCPNGHDMGAFDPTYISNKELRKGALTLGSFGGS